MQGERIGLIGENGCGKTTLILLLLGLLKPDDGRILIDGKNLNEYERRVYFAPVFQYLRLYPSSLGNNIYPFDELSKDNKFRILIPCFALDRTPEMYMVLREIIKKNN